MPVIEWAAQPDGTSAYQVNVNLDQPRAFLDSLAPGLTASPVNARFIFIDETRQLEVIEHSVNGRSLDMESTIAQFESALFATNPADRRVRLILSRAVYRDQFLTGKLLGNGVLFALLLAVVGVATILMLRLVGGVSLTTNQGIKLALTMVMSWLYVLIFFLLAMFFALWVPQGNNALLLAVIVWLVFAFILPQIGDTIDLDNQLPGGFFARMGMDPAGEKAALRQFRWYEMVRNDVEEMSPTKHYERISFALLGVKPEFLKNTWREILQLKTINIVGLVVPIILLVGASYVVFLRQEA